MRGFLFDPIDLVRIRLRGVLGRYARASDKLAGTLMESEAETRCRKPLLGLMFVSLTKRLYESRPPLRLAAVPMAVLLVLGVAQFVTHFNTRYYAEWAYSAATKDMMALICARHASAAQDNVRIDVTWHLEPGVNFYRAMWRLPWMEKASRQSPDGDYDYYMLFVWGCVAG